jgi:hypothetical protein
MMSQFVLPCRVATTLLGSCFLGLAVQTVVSTSAAAQATPVEKSRPALMDREKEVAMALSSCPASARRRSTS